MLNIKKQSGSVSIFIVIFVTLLVVIITTSFMRIMLNDQQQASNSDLSQSAYDSAQAGVEDAKRAFMKYRTLCSPAIAPGYAIKCGEMKANMNQCNGFISTVLEDSLSTSEKKLLSGTGTGAGDDNKFEQAYTCTKVNLDTMSYLGKLSDEQSVVIPLYSNEKFNTIEVSWFSAKDVSTPVTFNNNRILTGGLGWGAIPLLPSKDSWLSSNPPIMRSQFINLAGATPESRTFFMYPSSGGTAFNDLPYAYDIPAGPSMWGGRAPISVKCKDLGSAVAYSCSVKGKLVVDVAKESKLAYLRLTAIYNKANYKVSLFNDTAEVAFKEVQPEIDSTGRANSLYRRIKSRVELVDTNFPYPEAAIDVNGSFCKNFYVTNEEGDYATLDPPTIPCTP